MPTSRKSDLEIAIERLDSKVDVLEMQINSTVHPNWPSRAAWRSLIFLSHEVITEYYKIKDIANDIKRS